MSAIEVIQRRLEEAGVPSGHGPKEEKPVTIAFVDVLACSACGLCVPHCPASCIETLPEGTVANREPQPVQVRFAECTGCQVCVEVCALLARADAVRSYDVNLIEQVLGTDIDERPEPAGETPQAWDDLFAEGGGFHHMGEGSQLRDQLTPEEQAEIAAMSNEESSAH